MKLTIDSIEISGVNRNRNIEADIEFHDLPQVIKDLGVKEILEAIDADNFLNEIGWNAVKAYFSDEIEDECQKAIVEAGQDKP